MFSLKERCNQPKSSRSLSKNSALKIPISIYIAETVFLTNVVKESLLKFLKLDGIMSNLTGYIETKIELMKLEVKEDLAKAISKAAVFIVLSFAATLFVLFISMAIAYKIGENTSTFTGFAIVAGFYAAIGITLWIMRSSIRKKLEQQFMENVKLKKK